MGYPASLKSNSSARAIRKTRPSGGAKASTRFLSCELAGKCFTGTVMGLYAASVGTTEAVMKVEHFKYYF